MKIIFSHHALIKIKQRELVKRLVIETVLHPDVVRSSYSSREERYKRFKKIWFKVVIISLKETIIVVTAHWVAKPKRN